VERSSSGAGAVRDKVASSVGADHVRCVFGDHDGRRVCVRGRDGQHDGRVEHSQTAERADPQSRIQHRALIIAHFACSHRVRIVDPDFAGP